MKRIWMLAAALAVATVGLSPVEGHTGNRTKLVGEVIDTVCYVSHDSRGADHVECARECAAQGISLGILEEKTGRVYVSLPVDHSSPNAKLLAHIARRVEVTGTIFSKGGLWGIFIESVKDLPLTIPSRGARP